MTITNILNDSSIILQEAVLFKREFGTAGEKIANLIKEVYREEKKKEINISNSDKNEGSALKKAYRELNDRGKNKIATAVFSRSSVLSKEEKLIILDIIIDNNLSSALGIKAETKFDKKDQDTIRGNVSEVRGVDLFSVNQKSFVNFFAQRAIESKSDPVKLFVDVMEAKTKLNNKTSKFNEKQIDLVKFFFNLNNKMSTNKFMSKLFKLSDESESDKLKRKDEASEFISNFIDNKDPIGNYDFNKGKKTFNKDKKIDKDKEERVTSAVLNKEKNNKYAFISYKDFRKVAPTPEALNKIINMLLSKSMKEKETPKDNKEKKEIISKIEAIIPKYYNIDNIKKLGLENVLPSMFRGLTNATKESALSSLINKRLEKIFFKGGKVSPEPYKMRGQGIDIKSGKYARVPLGSNSHGTFKSIYQHYYYLKEKNSSKDEISRLHDMVKSSLKKLLESKSVNGVIVFQGLSDTSERVIIKVEGRHFEDFFNNLNFEDSGKTVIKYKMGSNENVNNNLVLFTFNQNDKLVFNMESLYKIAKSKKSKSIVIGYNKEKTNKKPIKEELRMNRRVKSLYKQFRF